VTDKPGHRLLIVERSGPPRRTFFSECACSYTGPERTQYALAQDNGREHLASIPTLDIAFFVRAGFSEDQAAALERAFTEVNR
jgi:hypothetical protein